MASRHPGLIQADMLRLFDGRSVAGLGDGELLNRFVEDRDEPAFEALVTRLGPMVLGVCRRMLADPHDVDDAFQATFLVLVRRAGSIGDRDLVAPWLHGVAAKVAGRARVMAIRRAIRERHDDADPVAPQGSPRADWSEVGAAIDEEIGRLPEHHRQAVVLCDVEGLSREEAAERLGWSLNMVRGRLDRARGRLRERLIRRGLSPSGAMMAIAPMVPRPALVAMTVSVGLGRSVGVGAVSASVFSMTEGVVRMMVFSKARLAAVAMLSTGVMVAGAGLIAAQGPGNGPKPTPNKVALIAPAEPQDRFDVADPITPRSTAELNKARVVAAKERLDKQKAFYEEGRITLDRLVDAAKGMVTAEIDAASSKADRVKSARIHYFLIKEILRREKAELEVGRATTADVAEAETSLLDAELLLARQLEATEPVASGSSDVKPGAVVIAHPSAVRLEVRPSPSSLALAIKAFNAEVENPNIHWSQPPLTEDEVIAAIRFWRPDRETLAIKNGLPTNLTAEGTPIEAFKRVAETRELPPGSSFRFDGTIDLGHDFIYHGSWVTLNILDPRTKVIHPFLICSRLDRSITLEEALKSEEENLIQHANDPPAIRTAIAGRIFNFGERIKWRDREKPKPLGP